MLTVVEAIQQRRSIRHFLNNPVPQEMIIQMLEAARLAPSGGNHQPWRFVVVTDFEEKQKLRQICFNQTFIDEAPVVFVACTDLSIYSSRASQSRYQELAAAGVRSRGNTPRSIPELDRQTKIHLATSNIYIAIEHIVLTATALGLGSCWIRGIEDPEAIKTLLGLPGDIVVVAALAVGYPQSVPPPRPRLSLEEIMLRPLSSMV